MIDQHRDHPFESDSRRVGRAPEALRARDPPLPVFRGWNGGPAEAIAGRGQSAKRAGGSLDESRKISSPPLTAGP